MSTILSSRDLLSTLDSSKYEMYSEDLDAEVIGYTNIVIGRLAEEIINRINKIRGGYFYVSEDEKVYLTETHTLRGHSELTLIGWDTLIVIEVNNLTFRFESTVTSFGIIELSAFNIFLDWLGE